MFLWMGFVVIGMVFLGGEPQPVGVWAIILPNRGVRCGNGFSVDGVDCSRLVVGGRVWVAGVVITWLRRMWMNIRSVDLGLWDSLYEWDEEE